MLKQVIRFFKRQPDVEKWLESHPVAVKRVSRRLDSKTFFGKKLTLIILFSVASLWLLGGILQDYLAHDSLIDADVRIANLLFVFRTAAGLHFYYALTLFASPITGIVIMTFIVGLFLLRKQWKKAAIVFVGLLGAEGVTAILKLIFHRPRPDLLMRAVVEDSFSLPSGHATTAAFIFGFLGYQAYQRFKKKKARVLIVFLVALSIILIDISRLYLDVHYLSDVIAGNLIGFLGLLFVIGVDGWCMEKKICSTHPLLFREIVFAIVILFVVAFSQFTFGKSPWTVTPVASTQKVQVSDAMKLFASDNFSKYSETVIGEKQEPISLILAVPNDCLTPNFQKAGWTFANQVGFHTLYEIAIAAIYNKEYLSAPMTPSFYNALPHDYGFEKPTKTESVRQRHHARFWITPYQTADGNIIVGSASLDTSIKWGVTHSIAPDIDTERDNVVSDLQKAGVIKSQEPIQHFVPAVMGKNFSRDYFFTDGDAVYLKMTSCNAS